MIRMDEDALVASVDVIGRTGARDLEFGHTGDDHSALADVTWWAVCSYQGTRLMVEDHPNPVAALEALATRVLTGGMCTHCRGLIALSDDGAIAFDGHLLDGSPMTRERAEAMPQCRWHREGKRWVRGCEDRFPLVPSGTVTAGPNRAARRAKGRGRG